MVDLLHLADELSVTVVHGRWYNATHEAWLCGKTLKSRNQNTTFPKTRANSDAQLSHARMRLGQSCPFTVLHAPGEPPDQ